MKLSKLLWQKNILNTRKKTKHFWNIADNSRKRKKKWTKEGKKSRTVLTKSLNFTTQLRNLKTSDSTEKMSMNWLLLKETFSVLSLSGETINLLCCMKKSKFNNLLWPKGKLPSDKGWLTLNCLNTRNRTWKDNLRS